MQAKIILGVFIILIGVSALFDQFDTFSWFRIGNLWPIFLIVGGLLLLLQKKIFEGVLVGFLGISFLLSNIFDYNFFSIFWPLVIVAIGVCIIFKSKAKSAPDSNLNETLLFSGADKKIISQNFTGGKIECYFGGFKLDLRNAKISPNGAVIDVNTVFGGVEILVGSDMRVEADGTAILGGWENKAAPITDTSIPLLKITGSAILGGVEIR